ncbi:phage portal protein [Escherichia coli]|nr:phage portal protein [Escherichia coli]
MKRTPVLIDVNGVPLRESLSYNGGGAGFGGQMAEWLPPAQSADAALLPALRLGNARADDLVRNNGIAANAVALHKDHIVGHMFLISYRPNWRWLGMRETAAKSFVDEVEAAWSEYAEGMFGEIDVEGKRTFTEFIREGVGVHAFNGEIFVQPVWDTESTQLFRTRFKAVSPKRVDTPGHGMGNRFLRAGVEVDRYGRAVAYHICEDDFPFSGSGRWERIPRELPTGRPAMLHIFEPVEDGQTRGANQFYSVMERLKMLDSLQATQLQSAIVKAMYAATIESDLDTEKAFEYIAGAPQGQKDNLLINILDKFSTWYDTNSVTLGGVKIPHLFPGDDLKLQTAQDSDNGFSALEQALLRYIAAGLGVSYEQLSRDYSKVSYANAEGEQKTHYNDTRWHEDSVRNRWFSVMAGPSVRVNEWFSAYALAGVSYARVSSFAGDYVTLTSDEGKKQEHLTRSDSGRRSHTALTYSAGVQINPTENIVVDLAYEASGRGDWRTDAFIVGTGYRF